MNSWESLWRGFSLPEGQGVLPAEEEGVSAPEHLGSTQMILVINIMKNDKLYLLELCALSSWHLQGTMKSSKWKTAHVVREKNDTIA